MATAALLERFVQVTRTGANLFMEHARYHGSDHVARLSGRTADLVGRAGESAGELTETATARLSGLARVVAELAGSHAQHAGDRLAATMRERSTELGDGVIRFGEKLEQEADPATVRHEQDGGTDHS